MRLTDNLISWQVRPLRYQKWSKSCSIVKVQFLQTSILINFASNLDEVGLKALPSIWSRSVTVKITVCWAGALVLLLSSKGRMKIFYIKVCRWLDSNREPLVSEATGSTNWATTNANFASKFWSPLITDKRISRIGPFYQILRPMKKIAARFSKIRFFRDVPFMRKTFFDERIV